MKAAEKKSLVFWLEDHAESLMESAMARREYAECDRNATAKDLKAAKKMAEKMSGRKLDLVSATVEEAKRNVLMYEAIADKLEAEARMLSQFAAEYQELVTAAKEVAAIKRARDCSHDAEWDYCDACLALERLRTALQKVE